jgi:predicted Zn finger-like uncharacterized protein
VPVNIFQKMSLITRCPACETHFKVVPDQLRISEGWVRCGQCDEIFDASHHLVADTFVDEKTEISPLVAELAQEADEENDPELIPMEQDSASDFLDVDIDGSEVPEVPEVVEPIDAAELKRDSVEGLAEETMQSISGLPVAPPERMPDDSSLEKDVEAEVKERANLGDVSFLRGIKADRPATSPRRRVLWVGLTVALLFGLMLQVILHERDHIVAAEPGLKPLLQALCKSLNCTLSPLRRIEAIVVESASFTKTSGNNYRLNFTVKNSATTPLAVPAVELTLTDDFDQPVVRRVFLSTEMGVKLAELAPGAEWPASIAMEVKTIGASDPVAGYRVFAFYP